MAAVPADFLSKRCKDTFGGYAFTQVRAYGAEQKDRQPYAGGAKRLWISVMCSEGQLAPEQLAGKGRYSAEQCPAGEHPHFRDTYGLYL